ncbi:M48 family metallopeptidase [Haloferax volcanii]|uniref:M48 family metallopeptidase n=1 Tax=Haloferax volcanii TaxID=2246 RepID=A0A8T5C736_HALVO|nr:M48 family metallopeptidase [Haloferax volcanii]MBS8121152.1 M48 family metallopeptidase [Haloferax volcanii]MBS8126163.1 M48 family metallopeptidase [Haloferax volcanii]MBS8130017.1 M48 family metallopeptidase [Haloferax volcanii]MBS8133881.1 M48 family metallopeptidase [Haloferax volcanii]
MNSYVQYFPLHEQSGIQDYVVSHELAHFKHDEHSDAFWNTVGTLVPDYRKRREWLRIKGGPLTV